MEKLTKEDIIATISKHKTELEEEFGVKKIYLFGSYAKDEQNEDSDIDFIVDFKVKQKKGAITIFALGAYLKEIFNKEIDIGERHEVKSELKNYILDNNLLKC